MVFPIFAALIPVIMTTISAVTAAVSTIGPALAAYAAKVGPAIIKMAHTAAPILQRILEVADVVAPALDVFNKGETVESIGERSLQAAEKGITPERFDDFDEYMQEIRSFPLDEEKVEQRKSDTPYAPIVAGLGVSTRAIENKFELPIGRLDGLWLLPVGNAQFFTPERIEGLVRSGDISESLFNYLTKTLTASDSRSFEKNLSSKMDENEQSELYQALDMAKTELAAINKITDA